MSNPNTLLSITGLDIPPYAARGLVERMEPIPQAENLWRTVNGTLINVAEDDFQKYAVTITGNDQQPPGFNGLNVGTLVTVDCISELGYLTATGSADRAVVSGSSRTDGDYTFYRPQLSMRVRSFNWITDEWNATVGWSLVLEEA